jgi:hypothetical protein
MQRQVVRLLHRAERQHAKPVCGTAITSEWSPKIDSACVASVRAARACEGVSSPAILYMLGIISSRPCDAVKVVVSAPACSAPCTAPAAPPSDCISTTSGTPCPRGFAEHTRLMLLLVQAAEGPTLFLLDCDEVGDQIEMRPVEMIVNRLTTSLFIDGLRVADASRVGAVGSGLSCLMKGFAPRRIYAAAECIGNARFLLDRGLEHARQRVTFDRLIGSNQGVQYPLAQAYARVEAADLMRWDALRVLAAGEDAGPRSAMARLLASEASSEAGRAAMTAFGGWALAAEMHVERKLRDSMVFAFNNMLWSYLAERGLGLPKAF